MVGPGHRGSSMWGAAALMRHGESSDLVALCDVNPKRAAAANGRMETNATVFTDLDRMLAEARADLAAPSERGPLRGHLDRLFLAPRRLPRHRLLPALARPEVAGGKPSASRRRCTASTS